MLIQTQAIQILQNGGGLRILAAGLIPATLVQYAAAARLGNARLEIVVGSAVLLPQTMAQIAAAGGGAVLFDMSTNLPASAASAS
jgi:hypothetical protein